MKLDDPKATALFLDLDGTLIDIAPTPDSVHVPDGLAAMLGELTRQLDGALAIVTGRTIADVDRFLAPLTPVAAGVHGAELRHGPGGEITVRADPIDAGVAQSVRRVAAEHASVMVETKHASIAVHYRQAPSLAPVLEVALARILDDGPDHLILAHGRQVFEIVPRHVSKGAALQAIMDLPAFAGRRPVMIGDDVPDVPALEAAIRLGGSGLRVAGEHFSPAEADFMGPVEVRAWLRALSEGLAR
ncbi:MAG: trehalose-phosphatase [Hyphomicrobiaceae bacterium]|nr:trehalose-phosphatase [Hyphomicrobiaceae bacterium]